MSTTYSVGDQTKKTIIQESRKLFYKKGYKATTYDDIRDAANINRALIPYHFGSKQLLGQQIYLIIKDEFTSALDNVIDFDGCSPELIYVMHTIAFYQLLYNDKFSLFVSEIQADNAFTCDIINGESSLENVFQSKSCKLDADALHLLGTLDFGMEKELLHTASIQQDSIDQMAAMKIHMIMGYAGYSKNNITNMINQAYAVLEQIQIQVKSAFDIRIKLK